MYILNTNDHYNPRHIKWTLPQYITLHKLGYQLSAAGIDVTQINIIDLIITFGILAYLTSVARNLVFFIN